MNIIQFRFAIMSSSSSFSDEGGEQADVETTSKMGTLMTFLERDDNAVLLNKGKTPELKRRKAAAMDRVVALFAAINAPETKDSIRKKINNLDQRVKKKTDPSSTGNKAIRLLRHEKIFLSLQDAKNNPKYAKAAGAAAAGWATPEAPGSAEEKQTGEFRKRLREVSPKPGPSSGHVSLKGVIQGPEASTSRLRREESPDSGPLRQKLAKGKTPMTTRPEMSIPELQRKVLEQQLSCFKEMNKYYERLNQKLDTEGSGLSSNTSSPLSHIVKTLNIRGISLDLDSDLPPMENRDFALPIANEYSGQRNVEDAAD